MIPRLLSVVTLAATLAVLCALVSAAESVFTPKERELICSVADGFTLASVGDLLLTQPASSLDDAAFQQVMTVLKGADVAFGNFESNAVDVRQFRGYPAGDPGDIFLTAEPQLAPDLKRMGFSLVSRANNHTTDWGVDGMRETDRRLDAAGIVHAGTGETRASARAARYLNTPRGRIALISMASTFNPWSMAMSPEGEAPGRPGLNPLRLTTYAVVTADMMRSLRAIQLAQPPGSIEPSNVPAQAGDLELFGVHYRTGQSAGFHFEMNEVDRREILRSIRQGKENSDFLIATIHAHEPGNWSDAPADFLPTLAHQAIDAGADVFIGHGPHRLRGIEIYKGKPIFYSLGNFFYQDQLQQPMTGDLYEALGADPQKVTDAELGARLVNVYFDNELYYQSVIALPTFVGGVVTEIRLYPVELGFSRRFADRGVPRRASPASSRTILERLQRSSKPFGTVIQIQNDLGVIHLNHSAS
jgi:poly-gamma-glutamate synthesis protein (capsule biosynthesis protein)